LNVKQRNISIIKSMFEFSKLSRFAPYHVANEEMKMEQFKRALTPKFNMASLTFPKLQMMYAKAIKVQRIIDECEAFECYKTKKEAWD